MFQKYPKILFPLYFCIVFFFYKNSHAIILTDDAFSFFKLFEENGFAGYSQNYGFTSLYYFTHLVNIIFYKLLGTNTFYWLVLMIFLHSLNAYLCFILFKIYYKKHLIENATLIAGIASFIFLISPFQSENILWAATLHYALCLLLFFGIGIYILSLDKIQSSFSYFIIFLGYITSLLTMEMALVFPFSWYLLKEGFQFDIRKTTFFKVWLGLFTIIPLYFIATKLIKGHFIPHYSEVHLSNHGLVQYATQFLKYVSKTLFFTHFSDHKNVIYTALESPLLLWIVWAIIVSISTIYFIKHPAKTKILLTLFVLSFFFLMPVINMYFMVVHQYENNRLGYYFSIFLFQFFVFMVFQCKTYLRYLILVPYILICFYFTNIVSEDARDAGTIYKTCIQTFPHTKSGIVYLTNLPNNFKGFYLFRNLDRFKEALAFFRDKNPMMIAIAGTSLLHFQDSFRYEFFGDNILRVGHTNYGDYFMKRNLGATNYSEKEFDFMVDEYSLNYQVHFKKPLELNDEILIFQRDRFIKIW